MKYLFNKHYEAIKKRGLIDPFTTVDDFIHKMKEELSEFEESHSCDEAMDLICVCTNYLIHQDHDIKKLLKKNLKHQIKRNEKEHRHNRFIFPENI